MLNKYFNIRLLTLGVFNSIAELVGFAAVLASLSFVITYILTNV